MVAAAVLFCLVFLAAALAGGDDFWKQGDD